jgi:hypothetical protein
MMSSFARRSICSTNDLASIAAYLKTLSPNKDAAPFRCDDTVAKALFYAGS